MKYTEQCCVWELLSENSTMCLGSLWCPGLNGASHHSQEQSCRPLWSFIFISSLGACLNIVTRAVPITHSSSQQLPMILHYLELRVHVSVRGPLHLTCLPFWFLFPASLLRTCSLPHLCGSPAPLGLTASVPLLKLFSLLGMTFHLWSSGKALLIASPQASLLSWCYEHHRVVLSEVCVSSHVTETTPCTS